MIRLYAILFFLSHSNFLYSQADAGPDRAICGHSSTGVTIGNLNEDSRYCYSWTSSPADPNLANNKTAKITVRPNHTTTYTLAVTGQNFSSISSDNVTVFVVNDVTFSEANNQKYGFDDHTDPSIPWKSVENGKSDPIKVTITPSDGFGGVFFKVSSFLSLFKDVELEPVHAPSGQFDLKITGIDEGEDEVDAVCEKEDGDKIKEFNAVSYDLITKRVGVRVVNYGNVTSQPLSKQLILDYLNKVYNQAVCEWEVEILPSITANIDLNNDGLIDLNDNSQEAAAIVTNCKDDSYDYNIFLVDNIDHDGVQLGALGGKMPFGQKYGFVSVANHTSTSALPENTIAHEIGHGAFSLRHPKTLCNGDPGDSKSDYIDPDNIMDYCDKSKLRKFQWDLIHK